MPIETVTVVWTEEDIGQAGLNGSVRFVLSSAVSLGPVTYEPVPRIYPITNSAGQTTPAILANDTPGLQPPGSFYTISVLIPGMPPRVIFANVDLANGASQTLSELAQQHLEPTPDYQGYMPLSGAPFLGATAPAGGPLNDTSTVTIDASTGNDFTIPLTQNTLLATPLFPVDRQKILIQTVMGSPGGFVLSYSAGWLFLPNPDAPVPLLETAPGSRNYLLFRYDAGLAQWVLLAFL